MSNLRNKLIRLAHNNPSMRADILPLLSDKKALSNWGKKLASKTAASNESIADVMNVWFNQFGKDMVKYNKAVKVTKVTHTYIAFEANDKKGRLDIDAVGGLECEIDGKRVQKFSMKDKAGEIIGTIIDRHLMK